MRESAQQRGARSRNRQQNSLYSLSLCLVEPAGKQAMQLFFSLNISKYQGLLCPAHHTVLPFLLNFPLSPTVFLSCFFLSHFRHLSHLTIFFFLSNSHTLLSSLKPSPNSPQRECCLTWGKLFVSRLPS